MEFEEIKGNFASSISSFAPTIKEAAGQLLQTELNFEHSEIEEKTVIDIMQDVEYPIVALSFRIKVNNIPMDHFVLVAPDFVTKFYALMLMMDPDPEVGEEHIEGFTEGVQQVFGQIQIVGGFSIDNVNVNVVADMEELQFRAESYATSTHMLKFSDGSEYTVSHFVEIIPKIPDKPSQPNLADAAGDDSIADEDFMAQMFGDGGTEQAAPPPQQQMGGMQQQTPPDQQAEQPQQNYNVSQPGFQNFGPAQVTGEPQKLDILLDVELEVSVELGRKRVLVEEVLKFGKGTIIELSKLAGEPVEVYINHKKLAEGEVVVVDDHFAVRLTNLMSPKDRIRNLGM